MNNSAIYNSPSNPLPLREGARGRSGFTLLELIIAITILSIVVAIVGSGFRLGIRAWEKGEAETQETQRLRALSGLISQTIKSAFPYQVTYEEEKVILFQGEKDFILFATTSDTGFKWVRYAYKDGKLILTEGILPDKKFTDKIKEDEEIIDSDVGEVKFEYLSAKKDEGWKESWDMGDGIPPAVRVKVGYFQPFLISITMGAKEEG
ncbi:MAG: type II secretion system protein [Nitrospirae bacterium]|nr:type II secretion system protein [Nitrospirota bacterium]